MGNRYVDVLRKIEYKKNVLLLGAPGTGKSKLMNEVAEAFMKGRDVHKAPTHIPGSRIPIPATVPESEINELSFMKKANRKVFRTTFHQNTKHRDFLTGIVPSIKGGNPKEYTISEGILYRANEFAKNNDSAALLIIDEMNRGPAIEVFGGSMVAFELDKRLNDDGSIAPNTQFFEILDPETGKMIEYAFSNNLYILAAMNQADASVAPLDVAFLRRWHGVRLRPNYSVLYEHFGIDRDKEITIDPFSPEDVINLSIKALEKINSKILLGRGEEFQIGHGILLVCDNGKINDLPAAIEYALDVWTMMYSHIEELYFGDSHAIASTIGADGDKSPYKIQEVEFANEYKSILVRPVISQDNIYKVLYAAAGD